MLARNTAVQQALDLLPKFANPYRYECEVNCEGEQIKISCPSKAVWDILRLRHRKILKQLLVMGIPGVLVIESQELLEYECDGETIKLKPIVTYDSPVNSILVKASEKFS